MKTGEKNRKASLRSRGRNIGIAKDGDCQPGQMSGALWRLLRHPDLESPEEKSGRVLRYREYLESAKQAEQDGNLAALKMVADSVRLDIAELPSGLEERYFWPERIVYKQPLTFAEIEERLLADIKRRGLEVRP